MQKKEFKLSPGISESYDPILQELANELVYNYLANSFGDEGITEVNFETITDPNVMATAADLAWIGLEPTERMSIGKYFNERRLQRRRCRNIMIIGAGASYDSYNAIPLGRQMIESFEEIFEKKISSIPFLKEKFEQEKKEIKKLLIGDLDFENYLYLLSTFFVKQETLREEIKSHTGFRYPPCLFYEIIAHMLKHLFLDAVINFNFDEMLDQCILEEMGNENYHFVLSDGHTLRMEDIIVNGRIKAPVYIKPHGTFSHKSSLRFTKRHYLDLPLDIQEMLGGLLSGYRGIGKEVQRVNLICVGFDLASLEFNDIINEKLAPASRIYHFLHKPGKTDEMIKMEMKEKIFEMHFGDFLSRSSKQGHEFENIYYPINLASNPKKKETNEKEKETEWGLLEKKEITSPLAEMFSNIWRLSYNRFNSYNRPRSLGRHEIISYLLYEHDFAVTTDKNMDAGENRKRMREYFDESPKYFRDRILVEIAIELLRNNGNTDTVELLKGRAGHYFEKYISACKKFRFKIREQNSIYDFLYEFTPDGEKPAKPDEEKQFQATKIIFRIPRPKPGEEETIFSVIKQNFEKPLDKIYEKNLYPSKKDWLDDFMAKLRAGWKKYKIESELGVTMLLYLLKSGFLSSQFRENLLKNYRATVYNGLVYGKENSSMQSNKLMDEIFRIFVKSNTNIFFNIQFRLNDPTYKLWESYSVKSVLNTNLVLSTDFKNAFNSRNWDCLLTVLDTGDSIKKIFKENFHKYLNHAGTGDNPDLLFFEGLKKKSIVLLCSFETVEQIHLLRNKDYTSDSYENIPFYDDAMGSEKRPNPPSRDQRYKIEILKGLHEQYFVDFIDTELQKSIADDNVKGKAQKFADIIKECLTIVFVPFWEHNQHCSIFLKSVDKNDDVLKNIRKDLVLIDNAYDADAKDIENDNTHDPHIQKKFIYLFEGGYHMYRRGFSNSLSPLKIVDRGAGLKEEYLKRDIDKILLFYFNVLCRGIAYQVQNASQMDYEEVHIIKNLMYYRSWSPNQFYKMMLLFLGNLYLYTRDKNKNIL